MIWGAALLVLAITLTAIFSRKLHFEYLYIVMIGVIITGLILTCVASNINAHSGNTYEIVCSDVCYTEDDEYVYIRIKEKTDEESIKRIKKSDVSIVEIHGEPELYTQNFSFSFLKFWGFYSDDIIYLSKK